MWSRRRESNPPGAAWEAAAIPLGDTCIFRRFFQRLFYYTRFLFNCQRFLSPFFHFFTLSPFLDILYKSRKTPMRILALQIHRTHSLLSPFSVIPLPRRPRVFRNPCTVRDSVALRCNRNAPRCPPFEAPMLSRSPQTRLIHGIPSHAKPSGTLRAPSYILPSPSDDLTSLTRRI